MGETKVSLKLLIDTKAKRVLFAEAGKDFVDFLFHLFSLPLAAVVKLLTTAGMDMVGSLANLSKSVEALGCDYFQHKVTAKTVFEPLVVTDVQPVFSLLSDTLLSQNTSLFRCASALSQYPSCRNYVTFSEGAKCPNCALVMSSSVIKVEPKSLSDATSSSSCTCLVGGYVKGVVTYMVMDNLEVKPMSTISSIGILNNFNVNDVSSMVEKQVLVGLDEGIAILKASLESHTVLTTVFLRDEVCRL